MNESARPTQAQPINDMEARKLLEESNNNYRALLQAKDTEIHMFRRQVRQSEDLLKEYRDIIQLIKDVRRDALHHDC